MSSPGDTLRQPDAIVIGAGHNGLVCAAYLARAGLRVLVLERRAGAGGLLDGEPRAPDLPAISPVGSVGHLRPRVARELQLARHGLRMVESDARLTVLHPDGPPLTLWGDTGKTAAELRRISHADGDAFAGFAAQTAAFAGVLARLGDQPPPDTAHLRASDLTAGLRLWLGLRGIGARHTRELLRVLPMPIADHLSDHFESDLLRGALGWRGVRFTSLAASDTGSAQVFLADAAGSTNAAAGEMVVPIDGPAALVAALTRAAEAFGANLRCDSEVAEITTRGGAVSGVALADGTHVTAPIVVSGADPKRTLLGLLDPVALGPSLSWEAGNIRMPGSTSVVQLVLGGLPAFSGLGEDALERLQGRLLIGASVRTLDRAADAVKAGRIAGELVLEATLPSISRTARDEGVEGHLMNVVVHGTPYHRQDGLAWDDARDDLGDRVLVQLEGVAPGLSAMVEARGVATPLDLERDYGLTEGHPLHGEPGLDQWFAWRPFFGYGRYRMPVEGLYLCGSGAHPGGGISGAPGRLAAQQVLADRRQGRRRVGR